jgi:GntR family transcriptional repressor for pyruvate dehydrogenase complex
MRDALEALQSAIDRSRDSLDADTAFHRAIAKATKNDNFIHIFNHLGSTLMPRERIRTEEYTQLSRMDYLRRTNLEHHQILDAILLKSSENARAAMRTHLSTSCEALRQGLARSPGAKGQLDTRINWFSNIALRGVTPVSALCRA